MFDVYCVLRVSYAALVPAMSSGKLLYVENVHLQLVIHIHVVK